MRYGLSVARTQGIAFIAIGMGDGKDRKANSEAHYIVLYTESDLIASALSIFGAIDFVRDGATSRADGDGARRKRPDAISRAPSKGKARNRIALTRKMKRGIEARLEIV